MSHIIPEFLFKDLYGAKGSYVRITSDPKDGRSPVAQKAPREKVLCQQCETKLSRWEKYGESVLSRIRRRSSFKGQIYDREVKYEPFRLMLNSVLWRISISSLPEFSSCKIGPKAESILKRSLSECKPEKPSIFLFLLYRLRQVGKYDPRQTFIPPVTFKIGNDAELHAMVIYGFQFSWYKLSHKVQTRDVPADSLSKYGGLSVEEVDSTGVDAYRIPAIATSIIQNPKVRAKWIRDGGPVPSSEEQ